MIKGYLELNGTIFKINSEEDLKNFISRIGKDMEDFSENQFERVCANNSKTCVPDDCGVLYSNDGTKLLYGANNGTTFYSIKQGVLYICDYAFDWRYDYTYNNKNGERTPIFNSYNKNRTKIEKLFFPISLKSIGRNAFSYNPTICEIQSADNIEYIGKSAFIGCSNLEFFKLPSCIRYIGSDAFNGCEKLSLEVDFPNSLQKINARAFQGCKRITKVKLPKSIKTIGSQAFKNCENLEKIFIPDSIEEIGPGGLFEGCSKLSGIYIPIGAEEKFNTLLPFYRELFVSIKNV